MTDSTTPTWSGDEAGAGAEAPTGTGKQTESVQHTGARRYVRVEVDGRGIATILMDRAESANGMNVELLKELHAAILEIHRNPAVRAVLLKGAGKHFSAGGDIHTFAAQGARLPDYLREATAWLQLASSALIQLRVPVIAVVQGFAAGGGGLGLVCASDFVIAASSARFMSGAVRVGMAPDGGSSATLARIVGFRKAAEILLTNPTIPADEAHRIGLVTAVAPDDELASAADAFAAQFSGTAPLAIAATKRLLWESQDGSVQDAFPRESHIVSELSGTADSQEGLAAVIEERSPVFRGE